MMLPQRLETYTPPALNLASAGVLGTTQKVTINRTFPIEEILLILTITAGATGPTLSGVDNVLGIVKNIDLSINDGVQPRSVINASGVGLLEYASQVGINLDRATLASVLLCQGSTIANNMVFRIAYRIPVVHPMISEPLRTRMLMPCHTWNQDMVMTVTFEQAANMYSAGSLSAVACDLVLVRRQMDDSTTAAIQKAGGFINFDLLERGYNVAVGVNGQQRFSISTPGSYAGLLMRTYKGGASITRDVIDQVTTAGSETLWDIESGGVIQRQWRMRTLQTLNDWSRVANSPNQTYSPNFAGAVAGSTSFQPASSVYLDFLSDGIGGDANELGSVLDCNLPTKSGLLMELVGSVASAATNGHVIYLMGHRWYGDLSKWQAIQT